MVLPGHLAGGYLATYALLNATGASFDSTHTIALYVIGILAAEMPDLDLIPFFFEHRSMKLQKTDSHRKYASHAPAVWLIIGLVIAAIGYLLGSLFTSYAGFTLIVGSWSHFIADSIEYGIMWLWPFSHKQYALHKVEPEEIEEQKGTISYYWTFIHRYYIRRYTFWVECLTIALAAWVAFR